MVDLLVRAVNGEQIKNRSIDPLTLSPIGPFGTRANIARFKPEFLVYQGSGTQGRRR